MKNDKRSFNFHFSNKLFLLGFLLVLSACSTESEEVYVPKSVEVAKEEVKKFIDIDDSKSSISIEKDNKNEDQVDQAPIISKTKELSSQEKILYSNTPEFDKENPFAHIASSEVEHENKQELLNQLPAQLQKSASKYPEEVNELLQYFDWEKDPESYDIDGLYSKGEFPSFIQWDSRWGFNKIGNDFIAHSGCGPVVLANLYIYYTGDTSMNPVKMSQWAAEQGYFIDGAGSGWETFTSGAQSLGLSAYMINPGFENVKNEVEKGRMIVLNVTPGDFTKGGHYIVIKGIEDNKLVIHDPNSPKNSQMLWDYERVASQSRAYFSIGN